MDQEGGRSLLGYKVFVRSDGDGFIDKVMAGPANEGEQPHLPRMAKGANCKRLLMDKGLASAANREALKKDGIKSGIMHRAVRDRPLTRWQRRFNRLVSKDR